MLLEAMDELEVAFSNTPTRTDCNHIFLNFVPTVIMDPIKVSSQTGAGDPSKSRLMENRCQLVIQCQKPYKLLRRVYDDLLNTMLQWASSICEII